MQSFPDHSWIKSPKRCFAKSRCIGGPSMVRILWGQIPPYEQSPSWSIQELAWAPRPANGVRGGPNARSEHRKTRITLAIMKAGWALTLTLAKPLFPISIQLVSITEPVSPRRVRAMADSEPGSSFSCISSCTLSRILIMILRGNSLAWSSAADLPSEQSHCQLCHSRHSHQ